MQSEHQWDAIQSSKGGGPVMGHHTAEPGGHAAWHRPDPDPEK